MSQGLIDALKWIVGILGGMTIIQVAPIQIDPWSWLGNLLIAPFKKAISDPIVAEIKGIEKEVNGVEQKVDTLQNDLTSHINSEAIKDALEKRRLILQFNDQIIQGNFHTKESWDQILDVVDDYEDFCLTHPEFPNNKCLLAIEHIKSQYQKHLDDNSFLEIDEDIKKVRKAKQKKKED